MGHNVRVAHLCYALPTVYSWIGKIFGNYGLKRMWSVSFLKPYRKKARYEIDDIPIIYIPVIHPIPHILPSKRKRNKAYKYLKSILDKEEYVPDYVMAHWHNMAYFMPLFKRDFTNVKTSVVIHNHSSFQSWFNNILSSVDTWGFRSNAIRESFEAVYGKQSREFICLSGVPAGYIPSELHKKDFSNGIHRFVFVGSLLKLKNIDISIRALTSYYKNKDFIFDIVGDGPEMANLIALVEELDVKGNVVFHGRLARDKAQEIVDKAQVFIMVSSPEAFGLVYVEAMAKGCIPIASIGQGGDGFIYHEQNGFLCEAKSEKAINEVIETLHEMGEQQLNQLSYNAYITASNMTDELVAKHYLESVTF